jgi:magnesium chelatase subunit H
LCTEWRDTPESRRAEVADIVLDQVFKAGLNSDLDLAPRDEIVSASHVNDDFISRLFSYLCTLEQRLFSSGLHVFGRERSKEDIFGYIEALLDEEDGGVPEGDRTELANAIAGISTGEENPVNAEIVSKFRSVEVVRNATKCAELLVASAEEELKSIVRGLNGEYIDTAPGGDLLRDGPAVLPTGRNCYALDPYRLPSMAAFQTGVAIAESVIAAHREKNDGAYPETIAVPLWGLDNIKTRGESVGMVLGFVGARPTVDGTGRVARFDLIPMEDLRRPRVDVVCNLSGIFRDSFEHVVHLLDDMFARASALGGQEGVEWNFVAKHAATIASDAPDEIGHSRLFSNPAGDFGSMVNERVASSNWNDGNELSETYVDRNSFIYGRKGAGRKDQAGILRKLLKTTDRVVQCIDSVEYGLSDIQEYYANTGALVRAARVASGKDVGASIVESFGGAGGGSKGRPMPRELNEVLRLELRTRLLNPKWSAAMKKNGAGGAFEISTRMTALVGWGGTVEKSIDGFVFDQAAARYVVDKEMRDYLKSSSPEAFRNVVGRLIEAHGRGMWEEADEELLDLLRVEYDEIEDKIEGV